MKQTPDFMQNATNVYRTPHFISAYNCIVFFLAAKDRKPLPDDKVGSTVNVRSVLHKIRRLLHFLSSSLLK